MDTITCACGCVCKTTQKFCYNCGAPLVKPIENVSDNAQKSAPVQQNFGFMGMGMGMGFMNPFTEAKVSGNYEPVNIYPSDEGLKLLIDVCEKVGPLVTGDRITETVLYYNDKNDTYEVHYYASCGSDYKVHEGYYSTKEIAGRALAAIDEKAFENEINMPPMCGGSRIIKYYDSQGNFRRVEVVSSKASGIMMKVSGILGEACDNKNRIIPENAKKWTECSVISTGMSQNQCYNYIIKRSPDGTASVSGKIFIDGEMHEINEPKIISENTAKALPDVPVGLLISEVKKAPGPSAVGFMLDGSSLSCTVTYEDGKTDSKNADSKIISSLTALISAEFV